MYLIKSLKADFRILERLGETDELIDRCRHLTNDVGERHHHAKRHRTFNDRFGCQIINKYVCGLSEEHRSGLLYLSNTEPLQTYLEELYLYAFPFPAFLPLAVVEFDVLHALNQLYHLALLQSGLVEALYVQLSSETHEEGNPNDI